MFCDHVVIVRSALILCVVCVVLCQQWSCIVGRNVSDFNVLQRDQIVFGKLGVFDIIEPNNLGCGSVANFDYFIYIHYAVPLYSARISTIYVLQYGKALVGLRAVCRVQSLATKQNAKFTEGGWNLRSYFNQFVDQSFRRCGAGSISKVGA